MIDMSGGTIDRNAETANIMIDAIKACGSGIGGDIFNINVIKAVNERLHELPVRIFKEFYSDIAHNCSELIADTFEKRTNYGLAVAATDVIETITKLDPSTAGMNLLNIGGCLAHAAHDGGMDAERMKSWKAICGTYYGILEKHPEQYKNYSISNVQKAMEEIEVRPSVDYGFLHYAFESTAMKREKNKMLKKQEEVLGRVSKQYTSKHMFR